MGACVPSSAPARRRIASRARTSPRRRSAPPLGDDLAERTPLAGPLAGAGDGGLARTGPRRGSRRREEARTRQALPDPSGFVAGQLRIDRRSEHCGGVAVHAALLGLGCLLQAVGQVVRKTEGYL